MIKFVPSGWLLALAAACGAQAPPAVDQTARKWLAQQYSRLTGAMVKKDFAQYERVARELSLPEFRMTDSKGRDRNLKQVLEETRLQFAMTRKVERCTMKVVSIMSRGRDLLVTTDYNWLGKVAAPGDPKIYEMMVSGRTVDTWSPAGTRWKLKAAKALTEKLMINGKSYDGAR